AAGEVVAHAAQLAAAPAHTALRLIAHWIWALTGAPYPPRREALQRVWDHARTPPTLPVAPFPAAGGVLATVVRGTGRTAAEVTGPTAAEGTGPTAADGIAPMGARALVLFREVAACPPRVPLAQAGGSWDARLALAVQPGPSRRDTTLWLGALGPDAPARLDAWQVPHATCRQDWAAAPRGARAAAPALFHLGGGPLALWLADAGWAMAPGHGVPVAPIQAVDLVGRRLASPVRGAEAAAETVARSLRSGA
ncbi:MAG: hypothetical protein AAF677_11130, partial [Pseudomonadota bacterium]